MADETLKEKVEAEAARAEAEDTEPDAAEEEQEAEAAEATEPPAPEPSPEEQSAEAQAKALDKAMTAFERALRKALEIAEPLREAPYEGVAGYLLPGVAEYATNDKFKTCPTCHGMGDVLTGSMKAGNEFAPCPRCGGRGYLEKQARVEQPAGTVSPQAQTNGEEDEYGVPSWMGDPSIAQAPPPLPTP
jgi:Zn-finger nucleic acid-binding protein